MTSILYEINETVYDSKLYDNYVLMSCIFHSPDRHPSLLVYPDKYRCLSCGAWGKTRELLRQLQSHSITLRPQQTQFVRNPFNRWLKEDTLFDTLKTAYKILRDFPQQGSYLYKRKLEQELISKLKCGYLDGYYLIPILDESQKPLGALARAGESITNARYFVPRGQNSNLLYSPDWQAIKDSKEFYLTFGVFDSIAIHQCGRPAMSTTSGKRLHPTALQDFRKKIIIVPDRGEEKEAKLLANNLGWRGRTFIPNYPVGTKDASDLHNAGQLQGILQ